MKVDSGQVFSNNTLWNEDKVQDTKWKKLGGRFLKKMKEKILLKKKDFQEYQHDIVKTAKD